MRMYCGLAAHRQRLAAAVVDAAGRLLTSREIADGPTGYADLGALLTDVAGSTGGDGVERVPIAVDSPSHTVAQLLAVAGRAVAYGDDELLARVMDTPEPTDPPDAAVRRAAGLARALRAGTLNASPQPMPRAGTDPNALRVALATHSTLVTARAAAAGTLRDVLRELAPAVLTAFADPAAPTPLAILEAAPDPARLLTEPGLADQISSHLRGSGHSDGPAAVSGLCEALAELPLPPGAVGTVGAIIAPCVAAIRSCEQAAGAALAAVSDRVEPRHRTLERPEPAGAGGRTEAPNGHTPDAGPRLLRAVADLDRGEPDTGDTASLPTPVTPRASARASVPGSAGTPVAPGAPGAPSPPIPRQARNRARAF